MRKEEIYDTKIISGKKFELYMIRSSKDLCKLTSMELRKQGLKVRIMKLSGHNRWGVYKRRGLSTLITSFFFLFTFTTFLTY